METSNPNLSPKTSGGSKKVAVALQGGGSHGAFSWGVLDRLFEDGRFEIVGFSGTSAGGMNATAATQGLLKGGNQGARDELKNFWRLISDSATSIGIIPSPLDRMVGKYGLDYSPMMILMNIMRRNSSPYLFNPLDINLLRNTIEMFFDFDLISNSEKVKLFLCATNVKNASLKIFQNQELTAKALLATAALPNLFRAVEIDGHYYWDGGFIGNPAIFPLIYNCDTSDIVVISLTPMNRVTLPKTHEDISWRLQEISLINTLVREVRAIDFITKLIDNGIADASKLKRVYMHSIQKPEIFTELSYTSPMNSDWSFMEYLFSEGRLAADSWIKRNFERVGKESTWDLSTLSDDA